MKRAVNSIEFERKRRFYTLLPLVLVPFLTLLFWMVGTFTENESLANSKSESKLNINLPDFQRDPKEALSKMNYYDKASADSIKLQEMRKINPYYQMGTSNDLESNPQSIIYNGDYQKRSPEVEIYRKLNQLNTTLNQEPEEKEIAKNRFETTDYSTKDVKRLEQIVNVLQQDDDEDPELKQLDGMLEKIMALQYPESYREKLNAKPKSELESIYDAIPAEIDIKQKVTSDSVVKLKITEETIINGQLIPKGHYLYGACEIYNQRLKLRIKNIRLGNAILPVDLIVYDKNDGMEGINLPEVLIKDALRSGSDDALQGLQMLPFDQSLETQIAGAGIAAAKGLLSKKLKPVRARLDEGYPLLLKDNSKKIN